MNIVIDTNIIISALIKDGLTREIILNCKDTLLFPEFEFEEIEKHKEEIIQKSGLSEDEFNELLDYLLKYVHIIKTIEVLKYREEAYKIIGHIDKEDILFIATALAYKSKIWSDDYHFQMQDKIEILKTKDMIEIIKSKE
ncbi:MAG TPA: PIN domain-containing protein [Candidatus Nanoarchaeia archaeon]|nr:PIN domain-containing protein [Candidatus Nanoarchaeia archaeon]